MRTLAESKENPAPHDSAGRHRSVLYRIFTECLNYPDAALAAAIAEGEVVRAIRRQVEEAGYASAVPIDDDALSGSYDPEDLQVEYSTLFDGGLPRAACSLCESGHLQADRMVILEDVLRFYEHFGLAPPEHYRVPPDHLTAELEFLQFLAYREASLVEGGEDPGAYQRGQYDFLMRHPARWVPTLVSRLSTQGAGGYYLALANCIGAFLVAEIARLAAVAGRRGVDPGPTRAPVDS